MNRLSLYFIITSAVLVVSCGKQASNGAPVTANQQVADSILPPVENKEPNTEYKPAFAGQTRIAGVQTSTPFEGKILTEDLNNPWAIIPFTNNRFLVTEKKGNIRIVNSTGAIGAPISGVPEVNSKGQGGLLDIAIDPAFAQNRMLYWTFSESVSGGNLTAVAKGRLSDDEKKLENVQIIYRATPAFDNTMHYGSRIAFDKTGNILISTGERSDMETRPLAQSLTAAYGKIIRITTDGKAAAGNPFANRKDARPEFYSYGHRNPQGLALHPTTGDIWISEMGPRGGDEINLIKPGMNYGWPTITYGIEYSGAKIGQAITQQEGLEQPIYYWDPVTSPSGIAFYSDGEITEWNNNLFVGGLSSKHIIRLVIENNKVVGEERLLAGEGQRFRDVTQGSDGVLYAVTDEGRLYRIGKK